MLLLFPPLSGCVPTTAQRTTHSPGRVSSKQILNGKECLSCTFPAGGLPSYMPQHDAAHKSGLEGRGLHAAEPTVIVSGKKAVVAMTCPEMY